MKTIKLLFCLFVFPMSIHAEDITPSCLSTNEVQAYIQQSYNALNAICQGSMTCMVNQAICAIVEAEGYDIDHYKITYTSDDACVTKLPDLEVTSICTFDASYLENLILNNILCLNSEVKWIVTPYTTSESACDPIIVMISRQIIWSVRVLTYIEDLEDEIPLVIFPVENNFGGNFEGLLHLNDPSLLLLSNLSVEELEEVLQKLIYLDRIMNYVASTANINLTINTVADLDQLIQQVESMIDPKLLPILIVDIEDMEITWGGLEEHENNTFNPTSSNDDWDNWDESDWDDYWEDYFDDNTNFLEDWDLGDLGLGDIELPNPLKQDVVEQQLNLTSKTYPNPFQNKCIIQYNLPRASSVSLSVYNASGQKVWTNKIVHQLPGQYALDLAIDLPQGMYTYHIEVEEATTYGHMIKID